MKHPNNPYDRADSYRVAVAIRNKHVSKAAKMEEGKENIDQSIPTSNIFARFVFWILNINTYTHPEDLELLKKDFEIDEHRLNLEDFYMKLGTDPKKGFSQTRALEMLAKNGPNNILATKDYSVIKGVPNCVKFLQTSMKNTLNGYGIILWMTTILCFLVYGLQIYFFLKLSTQYLYIAILLIILNLVNGAVIGYQKIRLSSKLTESFSKMVPKKCTVLRGGSKWEIPSEEIVVGDIVEIKTGNLVPADMRLIETKDVLKVDPYNLFGRHELLIKHHAFQSSDPLASPNLIFASTKIKEGIAKGVVISTGANTIIGRIISLAENMIKIEVPLSEELRDLVCHQMPVIVILLAITSIIVTLIFTDFTWLDGLIATLALVIAFIPESFYITLTGGMILAEKLKYGTTPSSNSRLTKILTSNSKIPSKGSFKNLESIETMGALTTLLIDDSSLFVDESHNKISHFWYDANTWTGETSSEYAHSSRIGIEDKRTRVHSRNETWHVLSRIALCCNPYSSSSPRQHKDLCIESPADLAILKYMESIQGNVSKVKDIYKKIVDVPTKNPKQMQMTIHLYENTNHHHSNENSANWRYYAFIKGNPLFVIQRCSTVCIDGRDTELTDGLRKLYYEAYTKMMGLNEEYEKSGSEDKMDGKHVIAYAEARLSHKSFPQNFDFLMHFGQASLNSLQYESSDGRTLCSDISKNDDSEREQDGGFNNNRESYLFDEMEFRLVGMIGLTSLAKCHVNTTKALVQKCKNAGIKVVMLTSQNKDMAKAIAKRYGIFDENCETIEDIAEKMNVTADKIDPSEANCHIIDCDSLRNMTFSEIDNTISSFLYNYYSTNTLNTLNTQNSMNQMIDATGNGTNFQILFCNNANSTSISESHDKLRLIESFQRLGDVIAVTGRNTPDCVALKRCDIGVALDSANEVAKESADITLNQDNFSDIIDMIEEGRIFYDNLKKSVSYMLISNMSEMLPFLVYIILNIPMPLGIVTMLCIDLGTDLLPSIALFNEKAEGNVMKRRPRDIYSDKLANIKLFKKSCLFLGIVQAFAGFLVYFIIMAENGFRPKTLLGNRLYWNSFAINDLMDSYGQEWTYLDRKNLEYACYSGFFLSIVITQVMNVLICRNRIKSMFKLTSKKRNRLLNAVILLEVILAIFLIYTPGINYILGFYPLKFWWLLPSIPFALFIFLFDEFRKFLIRRDPNCSMAQETLY
ncbi:unnamed protein product [Gordionus sp. m RMFG-2023]|uniref:sodium/potassium-transporting ATPase subunit alpha-like n=1 Tax=Gordionus sp. m RMFG-2023 TaxID=3053472 RepID=UPI0030DFBDC7